LLMILLSVVSVILLYVIFEERFAGLMSEEQKQDPYTVLPKFDIIPAGICIYLWFVQCSVSTTQEVMASPYTIALYNWNDGQAVLYNGIIQSACAAISVVNYAGIAYTRIGRIDNRKMMLAGLVMFLIYHIISVPWPFYPGPLDYLNKTGTMVDESTEDHGGCYASYTWCAHSHRIPLVIYLFCNVIIFGFAYPYLATPNGTIFSHVLGPRRQEKMQGLFIFFGSVAQIVSPIFSTNMFEHFGYLWAMLAEGIFLTIGIALVLIYYRRLVPLKLLPPPGVAARYKAGLFYRL